MKVLRLLLKRWRGLWQSNTDPSSDINARKWAERIENVNRGLYKHH